MQQWRKRHLSCSARKNDTAAENATNSAAVFVSYRFAIGFVQCRTQRVRTAFLCRKPEWLTASDQSNGDSVSVICISHWNICKDREPVSFCIRIHALRCQYIFCMMQSSCQCTTFPCFQMNVSYCHLMILDCCFFDGNELFSFHEKNIITVNENTSSNFIFSEPHGNGKLRLCQGVQTAAAVACPPAPYWCQSAFCAHRTQ